MRFGLSYTGMYPLKELMEVAQAADGTAIEGIWLAEHLGYRDAFVPAAAVLSATKHLKVTPTAASPYSRNPMLTAMQAGTLAEMAPGRVALVLGSGSPMSYKESGMQQERPLVAMRECLHLIRCLWSGERVEWQGDMFQLHGATFHIPLESAPPVHMAAIRDRMLALAGEISDGVIISAALAPESIRVSLEKSLKAAADAGRSPDAFVRAGLVVLSVAESRAEAVEEARQHLAYLFRNQFVAEQLRDAGASVNFEALHDAYTRRDMEAAYRLISDELIELCSVTGTPADCRAMLPRYADAGLDTLVLNPLAGAKGGHLAMKVVQGLHT